MEIKSLNRIIDLLAKERVIVASSKEKNIIKLLESNYMNNKEMLFEFAPFVNTMCENLTELSKEELSVIPSYIKYLESYLSRLFSINLKEAYRDSIQVMSDEAFIKGTVDGSLTAERVEVLESHGLVEKLPTWSAE